MSQALMLDMPENPKAVGKYNPRAGLWAILILAIPTLTLYYSVDDSTMAVTYLALKQNWTSG